jgi:hypothetical protein
VKCLNMDESFETDCVIALPVRQSWCRLSHVKLDMSMVRLGTRRYKDQINEVPAGSQSSCRLVVSSLTFVGRHSTL